MVSIIIDLIVLGIIVISAFLSAKYGFVRTFVEIAGFVAILVLINSVSTPIAEKIYDKKIETSIIESVGEKSTDSGEKAVDKIWNSLPKVITDNASDLGISKQEMVDTYNDSVKKGADDATVELSKKIIKPIVVKALSFGVSAVLFMVLSIVVKLIARLLNGLIKKTFASKLNKILGYIVGTVKGVAIGAIFCLLLIGIISIFKNGIWVFTPKVVNNSFAVKIINGFLPENGLLSFFK